MALPRISIVGVVIVGVFVSVVGEIETHVYGPIFSDLFVPVDTQLVTFILGTSDLPPRRYVLITHNIWPRSPGHEDSVALVPEIIEGNIQLTEK